MTNERVWSHGAARGSEGQHGRPAWEFPHWVVGIVVLHSVHR